MTTGTHQYVTSDRLEAAIAGIRTEMAQLRADIEKRFAEQTKGIVGWMTRLLASATAILITVLR